MVFPPPPFRESLPVSMRSYLHADARFTIRSETARPEPDLSARDHIVGVPTIAETGIAFRLCDVAIGRRYQDRWTYEAHSNRRSHSTRVWEAGPMVDERVPRHCAISLATKSVGRIRSVWDRMLGGRICRSGFMSKSLAVFVILLAAAASARADLAPGEKAFKRGDYAAALRAWRPLAEQGIADAQSNLGRMYKLGLGVKQDYAQAVIWYRKASDQGHAEAQHNMGGAFFSGKGVPQDYAEASRWFRRAAENGHIKAQFNIGLMYARGEGVEQNDVRAYKWLYLAVWRAPLDDSQRRMVRVLHSVAARMSSDQVLEAAMLIREWLGNYRETREEFLPDPERLEMARSRSPMPWTRRPESTISGHV